MSHANDARSSAQPSFRWRYLLVFLLVVGPIVSWLLDPAGFLAGGSWLGFLMIHLLVPALDALIGEDDESPLRGPTHRLNRLLPLLCLPAWYLLMFWAMTIEAAASARGWWGLALSLGASGGILAINAGHELIHRPSRAERTAGALLLIGVCYGAFKIEHVRGHHLRVATPLDSASARRGESVYAFIPRSVLGTLRHAWTIERDRLVAAGTSIWSWRNEWLRLAAGSLALALLVGAGFGATALAMFLVASAVAIVELEVINYIEHYGLERRQLPDGRFEPVTPAHSWNANTGIVNAFLFNLQRHADHHAHAGRDYLHLRSLPQAPTLPAGYGAMVLAALVPPLWRRLMEPRLQRLA
ncbi:MAG: alkane 1-monooxygenase [Burkholderiales bacterium]|nr:MAG: alkane 1-monooxygenase [Burkholderiales bacterium]